MVAVGKTKDSCVFFHNTPTSQNDYMKQWLEKTKLQIRPTTYSGYSDNAYGVIISYFESMKLKLREVTPKPYSGFFHEAKATGKGHDG